MVVSTNVKNAIAVVTIDNPPVNAASQAVRAGILDAIRTTDLDDTVLGVVLICAGRTFIAGADVREFDKPFMPPDLPDVVSAIEAAKKPWIAALHGTALGGGLELALGCHYRIAVRGAKMGLPEVHLGLIPGAGGTVRLPRLVDPAFALNMIASGKPITAGQALESSLIDHLVPSNIEAEALRFARHIVGQPLPKPTIARQILPGNEHDIETQTSKIKSSARGQHSPLAACDAISNALTLTADHALAAERKLFMELKQDPQSLALRHVFFAERAAGKLEQIKGLKVDAPTTIGVIGGGTMGIGIAANSVMAGFKVILIERETGPAEAAQKGVGKILKNAKSRGLISALQMRSQMANLTCGIEYEALSDADIVIEAIFEDMAQKQAVFRALDQHTKPSAILASNTSYLNINEIAQQVEEPSRVIGLHFFSPAHIMKLLEIVIPNNVSSLTLAKGVDFGKRLGKIVVPSGVGVGFIGNKIMSSYRRACEYMLEDGALPAQIDRAMRDFGFPMGIFEMQDLAGHDIAWAMRKRQANGGPGAEKSTLRSVQIADKLCELGFLGRKTGRGWYCYRNGHREECSEVTALILAESQRKNIQRRAFADKEIIEIILKIMQSTGEKLLEDGIAKQSSDIDVVMINGYGFPRWRGGPMYMRSLNG